MMGSIPIRFTNDNVSKSDVDRNHSEHLLSCNVVAELEDATLWWGEVKETHAGSSPAYIAKIKHNYKK